MRRLAVVFAVVAVVMALAAPAVAKKDKTWVCHVTHSGSNPVILVQVADGWDNGHGNEKASKHQHEDAEYTGDTPVRAGPAPQAIVDSMLNSGVCAFEIPEEAEEEEEERD
ncbi:MAG: hypothetical protein ACR2NG_06530 [Acidimicrobiia bacterium]